MTVRRQDKSRSMIAIIPATGIDAAMTVMGRLFRCEWLFGLIASPLLEMLYTKIAGAEAVTVVY